MPLPLVGAQAVLQGVPQFSKDADTVNSKIGGIHQGFLGLGGVAGKAGDLVAGGLKTMALAGVGAVTGIGAVGGAILKLSYDAANLPGIESVFKNMTNSMGVDAEALMGKMRAASYGAVKDFDLMQSANKAMVGAGKEFGAMFAESLPTLMQVSREAAKAQGLSVDYMYDSIVTGIKRMSPMILDNLGFQIQLGEANDKYAAKVGKSTSELTKEEKQMALLNEVMRLGNDLVEQSGGHVDSVQKSVMAWGTAWANIKDRVGIELLPILQKFMDILGKPGQGMQDAIVGVARGFVEWLLPAIDKVIQAISLLTAGPLAMLVKGLADIGLGGLKTIGESLSGMLTGDKINFFDLKNTIAKGLEPLLGPEMAAEMGKKAVDIVAAIQKGLEPIRNWIVTNLVPTFESIGGVIQGISDTLQGGDFPWEDVLPPDLADMAYNLVGSLSAIVDAVKKAFAGDWAGAGAELRAAVAQMLNDAFGPGVGDTVMNMLAPIGEAIFKAISAISQGDFGGAFKGIIDSMFGPGMGDQVMEFVNVMVQAFNDNLPMIMEIVGNFGTLVTNVFTTIMTVAEAVWPYVQEIIRVAWEVISTTMTIFYTQIFPVLLATFNTILEWVNTNWPAIQTIIVTVFTTIGQIVSAVMSVVGPFIIETFQGIADWTTENWPYIQETIVTVLNFILTTVQAVLQGIADFWAANGATITELALTIWEAIKAIVTTAIAIIQDVIMVVMGLIRGDWDTVWTSLGDIVKRIWELIKTLTRLAVVALKDIIVLAWAGLKVEFQLAWDGFQAIINTVWEAIKSLTGLALTALKNLMITEFGKIKTDWENLWKGLGQIVTDVWDGIKRTVEDAINDVIRIINKFIRAANRVISKVPGASPIDELDLIHLAQGGILNRPVFVAGEAGSEVVAPLDGLLDMIKSSLSGVFSDMSYRVPLPYSGPQPINNYDYGGNTYVSEYNLTTQSINRPGTLAMEFKAMELSHL